MNAVTGVGAPWYTSGVHVWNGTAATLKPSPTSSSTMPGEQRALLEQRVLREERRAMPVSDVEPVAPYTSAMPYRKIADENAPSTKYLMPASCELRPAAVERREHVERDRQDLEREEHDDEVVGGGHDRPCRATRTA